MDVANKPQNNGRPKQGNAPRVVKSASVQVKKVGAKAPRARTPPAQPRVQARVQAKPRPTSGPKIILQDPPRNARPAAPARAANNNNQARKPAQANNKPSRPNSAGSRSTAPPARNNQQQTQQRAPKPAVQNKQQPARGRGSVSELTLALQTANSIAINRAHPKQTEVVELLRTHEKGWIDDAKFTQVLKGLVF
jgi:hypothetical protein